MPRDPEHLLDVIDGAVENWEATSSDAMRWAPPERKEPEPADILKDIGEIFAPLTAAFRSLGEAVLEAPPVRRFFELVEDVPLPPEPAMEIEEEAPSCRCLCFRHAAQPGICTGEVAGQAAGVEMCASCMAAAR